MKYPEFSQRILNRKTELHAILITAFIYSLLVLIMWGAYNISSGLYGETTLVYRSESRSFLEGFFYKSEALRIHLKFFYHISYLFGEFIGIEGSYLPYQIVYALLWWARGFLVFLIMQKFYSKSFSFNYLIGSLVLIHSSDGALNFAGQLNQFGYIFWMVLSFYMFLLAFNETRSLRTCTYLVLAVFFEYMSLWSYQSQFLIILVAPLLILVRQRKLSRRYLTFTGIWSLAPIFYLVHAAQQYLKNAGNTYQESILRESWAVSSILSDLLFNISASLSFWNWASYPSWKMENSYCIMLALLAACVFVCGGAILIFFQINKQNQTNDFIPKSSFLWVALGCGLVLLVLSFPFYIILGTARNLWRIQFLSGIGAGLMLGSCISLIATRLPRTWLKLTVFLVSGALITFYGALSAVKKGAWHNNIWETQRQAMSQVIQVAPRVKPGTFVVLVNLPERNDPFKHFMWFDVAIRLAYPSTPVTGLYYFEDETPAEGQNISLKSGRWVWNRIGWPTLVREAGVDSTLFVEFNKDGNAKILKRIPEFLKPDEYASELYNPSAVIEPGPPSKRAVRRYIRKK